MSQKQHRKLAAILFADIVGYTALMQENEVVAKTQLDKFREVITQQVATNNGQIVNFYGDGCLAIFNAPLDAAQCAEKIQHTFQEAPIVPVRVGLHSGTVVVESDNVYGDAVNLTSRIESMGIPGSILLSERMQRDLKNQPSVQTQSLGEFHFKNVAEPMEVFALSNEGIVVPMRSKMNGKIKTAKRNKWLIPSLIGVLFLAALGYWKLIPVNSLELSEPEILTASTTLPPNVLNERVAVIPIQNNTNNPELDIIGKMAADWINRGLMEIETAEVVSPYTVNQHLDAIGILPNNPSGKVSFSELTGARNYIEGSFYKEKETMIFTMVLVDAVSGKMQFKFPKIRGNTKNKELLITQLREKIAGYWAAKDLVDTKKIKAPKYEAYQLYLEFIQGVEITNSQEALQQILEKDSTFYLPRLLFINEFRFTGKSGEHFAFLERHLDRLSAYELAWYHFVSGLYLGNPLVAFNSLNELRKKYPKDFSVMHETAGIAIDGLNNPQLAWDIYTEYGYNPDAIEKAGILYNWRHYHNIITLYRLEEMDLLKAYYDSMQPVKNASPELYWETKILATIVLEDWAAFDALLAQHFEKGYIMAGFLGKLFKSTIINEKQLNKLQSSVLEGIEKSPRKEFYEQQLYPLQLEIWKGNVPLVDFEKHAVYPSANLLIRDLGWAAITQIKAGNQVQIPTIIEELEKHTEPNLNLSAPLGSAMSHYFLGVIYTQLGKYEKALSHLKEAREQGHATQFFYFQYDRTLVPLYDMPAFKELTKPIWPKLSD